MLRFICAAGALCLLAGCEQPPKDARECFRVSGGMSGGPAAIRWNTCTGESWLLLREDNVDTSGKRDGSVWRWFPVEISKAPATSQI